MDHKVMTTAMAAELIGIEARTMEKWRQEGIGPPFYKVGRRVVYKLQDLIDWLEEHKRTSTK